MAAKNHLAFALVAAFFITAVLPSCQSKDTEPQIQWQPPAWQLTDAEGETFRYPEDLEGATIVLFWASWCPYCKALMPHLQSIISEYGGDIEVLALTIRDDEDPAAFLRERGFDFRLFEQADDVAEKWNVKGTPGLYLVDGTGKAIFSNFAIPDEAYPEDPEALVRQLKHYEKAMRRAPVWAAKLRHAIDKTLL